MAPFLSKLNAFFFGSMIRGFISSYFLVTLIGGTLLFLPFSVQEGATFEYIDALFVAASAISTTGLSPVVVGQTLTGIGMGILLVIIQFGGIGLIMALATYWLLANKDIGFNRRNMIMIDQNQTSRAGIVGFIKRVLIIIGVTEFIAFLIFFSILYFSGTFPLGQALGQSLFTVISLFTNAGFDIAPGADSMFMYRSSYGILSLSMTLMFLGAVGFWPLYDMSQYVIEKFKKRPRETGEDKFRFKIFTKWFVFLHLGVWLIGALLIALVEWIQGGFFASSAAPDSVIQGIFDLLFVSLTTRNAGFSTVPVTSFSEPSQMLMTFLMFLGSSPNSAGGGIRTITLMMVFLKLFNVARGRSKVVLKNRKVTINNESVNNSLIVVTAAGLLLGLVILMMAIAEPLPLRALAFEAISAFGTTGLSLGITGELGLFSKGLLIATMFIGRVGLIALITIVKPTTNPSTVEYPEVDVIVG